MAGGQGRRAGMRFATEVGELPRAEDVAARSGLEFMSDILAGRLPGPPICRPMGFRLAEVAEGRVAFEGRPDFDHLNPMGAVHGGWFGTLLDSCMACAVMTRLPKGRGYTTLEFKVNILRPLFAGDGPVRAVGTARHVGRRTGVAEGELLGADGRLYATGSTTCLVFEFG